jgi:hypothetical protein
MAIFFALLVGLMSGGFSGPVPAAAIVAPMDSVGGMSGG